MYKKHHTKAIVLGHYPMGENSSSVMLLTENFGLIHTKAQGTRKISSRLRSHLQKFSLGDFSVVHGKLGWKLVGARSQENFFESLKHSPTKLEMASNVINLTKKIVSEIDSDNEVRRDDSEIFDIISNFFLFIKKAEEKDLIAAECLVLLRILHSQGLMRHDPELAAPIASADFNSSDLFLISPRRAQVVAMINESLRSI